MNETEWRDRYDALLGWFEPHTPQYMKVKVIFDVCKDYLNHSETNVCYDWKLRECVEHMGKLEKELGKDMPLLEQGVEYGLVRYDWNNRKVIK